MLHFGHPQYMAVKMDEYTWNDHDSTHANNLCDHYHFLKPCGKLYHCFNDNGEVAWLVFIHKSDIAPSMVQLA